MAPLLLIFQGLLGLLVPQAGPGSAAPRVAPHPDTWRVELLTMGPGQETYSRFGHSAIRITDLGGKGDLVFNFGTFDDQASDVITRFLQGRLQYWLSVDTFAETREEYRREGRRLIAQELALGPAEKRALFRRLRWLAKPEHRAYRYHHYHANCSTRIRDELDRVTGGLLGRQLRGQPARTSRHWLRRATRGAPAFHLGFDLVLTASDRPIDRWEACFAPEQLMAAVASLRKVDGSGTRGQPFVIGTRELLPGPAFGSGGGTDPFHWVIVVSLGLACLILVPSLGWRHRALAWRLTGAGIALSGLAQLALAVLLLGLWSISTLSVFHANPNLYLFSPVALLGVAMGLHLAARPRPYGRIPQWFLWVAAANLAVATGYAVFRLFQAYPQGNGEVLVISIGLHGATLVALLRGRILPKTPV